MARLLGFWARVGDGRLAFGDRFEDGAAVDRTLAVGAFLAGGNPGTPGRNQVLGFAVRGDERVVPHLLQGQPIGGALVEQLQERDGRGQSESMNGFSRHCNACWLGRSSPKQSREAYDVRWRTVILTKR
jgi:hypothetical protein